MKLITKKLEQTFEKYPLGSQDGKGGEAKVIAKFFNPCGVGTWLITEGQKKGEDFIMFGFCHLGDNEMAELGYVSLNELQNLKLPMGLTIERDLYFPKDINLRDACSREFGFIPDIFKKSTTVDILNVKKGDEYKDLLFKPYADKNKVSALSYESVYTTETTLDMSWREEAEDYLENLFISLNIDKKPIGFKGHSLSVSDIVVFSNDEFTSAYYCDTVGWKKLPDSFIQSYKEMPRYNLAEKLVSLAKDFDFYDYMDNMEIGETDEDKVNQLFNELNSKSFCKSLCDVLVDRQALIDIDYHEALFEIVGSADFRQEIIENNKITMNRYEDVINDLQSFVETLDEPEIDNEKDITDDE